MLGAPRMFARRARSLSASTRSCSQARPPMRCATPLATSGRCASTVAAPLPTTTTTTTTSMCMPPCLRLVGGCSGRTPALFAATSARFSPPQHLHHDVERIEDLLIPHEDAATIRTVVDLVRLLVDPLATHGRRGGLENVSLATFVAMPEQRQLIALGGDVAMHDVLKSSEYYAAYRDVRKLRLAGITTLSGWERMMMMMQSSTSSSSVCVDLSPYSRGVLERALTERNAKNNAGAQRGSADGQETNVLAWLTATIQKAVAEELRRGDAETPLLLPHARHQQQQQQHDDDDVVADATITTNVPENVVDVQPEEVEETWLHPRGRRGSSRRGDANNNKKKDVVADDEEAIRVIAAEDELAEEEEVVAVESVAARRPTRRRGGASASSPTTAPPEEVEEEEVVEIVEEVEEQVAADDDDAAANVDVDDHDHDDDAHARSAEEEEATAAMDEFNDDVASLAEDAPPPPKTKSPSRTPTSANNKIADDAETDEAELVHEEEEEEAAPPPPPTTATSSSSPPNPKLSRLADLMLRQFNAADGYLHSPRKELRQEEKHGQVIRVDDDTAQVDPLALFSTYHSAQVSSSDPMHVHALKRVWSQYNAHQMAMEEANDEAVDVFQKEKSVQALIYGAVLLRALSREEDVRLQPLLTTGSTCVAEQDVQHSGAVMMMPPPPNFGFPLLSSDVRPFKSKRPRSSPHTNVTAEDVAQGMEEYKHFLANAHNRASPFQPAIDVNGGCSVVSIVGSTLHLYETSIKDAVREEEVRRPFAEAMIGVLHLLRHGVLTRINTIHYHVLVTMLPSSEEEAGNMHHAHGSSLTTFVSIDVGGRFNSSERSRFAALTRPLGMEAEVAEYACLEDIINVVEEECSVSVVHDLLISREDLEALLTPTLVQLLPEVELAEEAEEEEMKMAEVAVATSSRKEAAATNVHDDEEEEEEEEVIEEEEVVEEVAEEEEEKEEPQQQQQQHYEEEEVVPAPAAGADEELGNDDEEEYEEVVEEYEVVEEEEEEAEAPPPPPASRSNNRREASASQRRPPPPPPVDEVEEDEPTPAAQPPRRTSRWFDDDDDDAHAAAAPPRRRAAPVATPPPPPPPQRTRAPVVERDDDDEEEVVVQRPRTRAANAGRRAAAPRAPEKVEEDDGDRWHIRRSGRR